MTKRQRDRTEYRCEFLPVSVRLQGNEMKRSTLVTNPLIPPQLTLINHKEILSTSQSRPAHTDSTADYVERAPANQIKTRTGGLNLYSRRVTQSFLSGQKQPTVRNVQRGRNVAQ